MNLPHSDPLSPESVVTEGGKEDVFEEAVDSQEDFPDEEK